MSIHYPVMNSEVISVLENSARDIFLDCTVGMGGHAALILNKFPESKLIAVDMDEESLEIAKRNMADYRDRVRFINTNFKDLFEAEEIDWDRVSGVLIDPGLSVYQIKSEGRGFSHSEDSKLDMRKDMSKGITAHEIVNTFNEKELSEIFEKYGEIRRADGFAKRIIERRLFEVIDTSLQLKKISEDYFGWRPKRGKTHPASKVFQALRIYVNKELEGISEFVGTLSKKLKKGARIVFLTFHSTEDRIIKNVFKKLKNSGSIKTIRPFPMVPTTEEIEKNNPSRSAKLRAVEIL